MNDLITRLSGKHRRLVVCALLAAASAACGSLVLVRYLSTDSYRYFFLLWNLFLAWIPFGASLLAYELHRRNERGVLVLCVGLLWLLFFPNAPYIVSDFVHLNSHGVTSERFIFWYDLVTISCFSWTGLLLGFVSLYLMQSIVRSVFREKWGALISWAFVAVVMALGGFGVYLGRFQRWNSWDIVHHPVDLLSSTVQLIVHPSVNWEMWGITLLFGAMMTLLYVLLYGVVAFSRTGEPVVPAGPEPDWKGKKRLVTLLD